MGFETLSETEWERVDAIWRLLDEGELESARREIEALERQRPGHADLRIVDAAVSLEEGDAPRALEVLVGAERSADPTLFFHLRAAAYFERADFERARDDAGRALAVRPDLPETHDLLSRVLEHMGHDEGAREHRETAHRLDPEAFPAPLVVSDEEFDRLVQASLRELPPPIAARLEELPILVESLPRRELLVAEQPTLSPDLLGLFVGRHLLERSHADPGTAPGAIFLFRRNLLRMCADSDELAREIRTTVQHEVGHLLGLDEDELDQWGLA